MAKLEVPVVLIPAMLPDMPVRFEPSIAGRVPVKFAAGKLVSDAPEPEKVVADKVPEELKFSLYEPPVYILKPPLPPE